MGSSFPGAIEIAKENTSQFAALLSTVQCAIHPALRSAVPIQLIHRQSPKEQQRANCPPFTRKHAKMQNPFDFDPRPLHLEDEDSDSDKNEKKGDGLPNPFEKALFDSRTLLISGPVDDKMLKEATVRGFAMEAKDPDVPITVFINSPGGSADAGFAIYDMLRFIAPPIRTVVNGLSASAGILIHLAGDDGQRYCMPESRFMIHQPSTGGRGQASDLDITAREILKLRDRYNRIIAETCSKTVEEVTESSRRDFWLDADQALEYGLINKILKSRKDLPGNESKKG